MRIFLAILFLAVPVRADDKAAAILAQVLAHRALQDFSLKARLFVGREEPIPVKVRVHNTTNETRTVYHAGKTELLVIQPVTGEPRWFLRGTGELTGARRMETLAGSHFAYYDLALPFLHWPNAKLTGTDRVRGQDCHVLEMTATGQPYARAKLWVDHKYGALLRAELFDEREAAVRRLAITSFKRLGELWIPRGIDISWLLPNQALPATERSRLEIYDGDYDAKLPAKDFSEENFR